MVTTVYTRSIAAVDVLLMASTILLAQSLKVLVRNGMLITQIEGHDLKSCRTTAIQFHSSFGKFNILALHNCCLFVLQCVF